MNNYIKYAEKNNIEGLKKVLDREIKEQFKKHPENVESVKKMNEYNELIKEFKDAVNS